jgi:hypothetical protein
MIDAETRKHFLAELEKSGNIYFACAKLGIARMTYYRWRRRDQTFRKEANLAILNGRENIVDIAEHALLSKVKQLDFGAIKFALTQNSPRYKQRKQTAKVILEHRSIGRAPAENSFSITDFVKEAQASIDSQPKAWAEEVMVPVPTARAMAMRAHEILARAAKEEAAASAVEDPAPSDPGQPG